MQLGGGRSITGAFGFYRVKEGLKSATLYLALFGKLVDQEFGVGFQKGPSVFIHLLPFLGFEFVDEGIELVGCGFVVALGDAFLGSIELDIEAVDDALVRNPAITRHRVLQGNQSVN